MEQERKRGTLQIGWRALRDPHEVQILPFPPSFGGGLPLLLVLLMRMGQVPKGLRHPCSLHGQERRMHREVVALEAAKHGLFPPLGV
jgi:hypothetical protein